MPDNNLPAKRGRGRPSVYTDEIAQQICEGIAAGQSLRAVCSNPGMPTESAVRAWAIEDRHGFSAHYTRARDVGLDSMADQCIEIADTSTAEDVNAARLRVDTRKWYLSKVAPKRYGDKLTLSGDPEAPITANPDVTEVARRVAVVLSQADVEESDT